MISSRAKKATHFDGDKMPRTKLILAPYMYCRMHAFKMEFEYRLIILAD